MRAPMTAGLFAALIVAAACSKNDAAATGDADAGDDAHAGKPVTGPDDTVDTGPPGPDKLSETGLYSDFAARTIAPGIIAFQPAHPLWSDGAQKNRYLQLPEGAKVDTALMDDWRFPVGTKAWKEFWIDGKLVETRMLWHKLDGDGPDSWFKVAYLWNEDGSDAIAKPQGVVNASGTTHDLPSQDDCKACHGNVRDMIIGFSAFQLANINDLADRLSNPPPGPLVVPGDGIVQQGLAYFHGNCGFCHNEEGSLRLQSVMRLRLRAQDKTPEDTFVYTTAINAPMRHIYGDIDKAIVPGQPEKSQTYYRMTTTDVVRMPPKATKVVDQAGSDIIKQFIAGLPP